MFSKIFLSVSFLDTIRYLPGKLSKLSKRFGLELKKGDFPHRFAKHENFTYCGAVPADENYLSFGETKLNDDTLLYLAERRASGKPWNFAEEMYQYNVADVKILRESVERYMEENFDLQNKLMERFGAVNPKNKLPHLHCFTPPYVTLASFSYACLRAFGMHKVKSKMFAVMVKSMSV